MSREGSKAGDGGTKVGSEGKSIITERRKEGGDGNLNKKAAFWGTRGVRCMGHIAKTRTDFIRKRRQSHIFLTRLAV